MATISGSSLSTASIDAVSARAVPFISGLVAGEALYAIAPCYIHTDGKVYMANTSKATTYTTDSGSAVITCPKVDGWTADAVASAAPVTLFGAGMRANFSTGMTIGTLYYVSGSTTKGHLSDAVVLDGDIFPIAKAISATDIVTLRP